MNKDLLIKTISKIHVEDGDYLFIEFPKDTESAIIEYAQRAVKEAYPNLRVMFHNIPLKFKVIRQEEENE